MTATPPTATLRHMDLLEPVSAEAPCGPDLEYDQAFVMLQAAVAPKTDAQYGDFVDVPQSANWAEIERDCRALLLRTKDLRLAMILLRCQARQRGAAGLSDGLAFLKHLLERYGDALHPAPVVDGERDPVMYANALATLVDPDGVLGDARDFALPKAAGLTLQLRDVEKSFAMPRPKDALAPESVGRLLDEWRGRRDPLVMPLFEARQLAEDIAAWAGRALGADAPDLSRLLKALQPFAQHRPEHRNPAAENAADRSLADARAVNLAHADTPDENPPAAAAPTPLSPPPATPWSGVPHEPPRTSSPQEPMNRSSALAAIRATRAWFEQNEPSSPVIVLLRQSERMVGKRFSEIAHAIPADLLAKWDEIDA
jgi:type VI secretion system protein ImpA